MPDLFRKHRIAVTLWTVAAIAAVESFLVVYYLDSWLTLPLP
jgi:hypothetical protein